MKIMAIHAAGAAVLGPNVDGHGTGADTRASRVTHVHKAAGLALVDGLVCDDDPVGAQIVCLGCGEQGRDQQQSCPNEYNFLEWLHFFPAMLSVFPPQTFFRYLTPKYPPLITNL